MRACWAAMILVLVQPSPASCATCRGTSGVPRVLALTHRHLHKSPCVRQPFAEISGSISFSPLVLSKFSQCRGWFYYRFSTINGPQGPRDIGECTCLPVFMLRFGS